MTDAPSNRVREYRLAAGLSQGALASEVKLARQSIHAIESSRAMPAVDVALRIAAALNSSVEVLFGLREAETRLTTEPFSKAAGPRVALASLGSRWVSFPLDGESSEYAADALALGTVRKQLEVSPLRNLAECRENVVVMGCAPALGILTARLNAKAGPGRFLWLSRSSSTSLQALAREQSHVAGVHLVDAKTGQSNLSEVRRQLGERAAVLIALGHWEVGLVVAKSNPKGIKRVEQVARKSVRLVAREVGSGARQVLDRSLGRAGLSLDIANSANLHVTSHRQVALAVAMNAADVGIATRDVAIALGLEFIPIAQERFDLVLPNSALSDPRVTRLFETLTSSSFRRELEAVGYDTACSGDRIADLAA